MYSEPKHMFLPRFNRYASVFVKGLNVAPTYNKMKYFYVVDNS